MTSKLNLHQASGATSGATSGVTLIHSYLNGKILIQNTAYTSSLIITPSGVSKWSIESFAMLKAEDFASVLASKPELLVFGTGSKQRFPSAAQTQGLITAQIGIEVMDTAAACRTYNLLAGDGRNIMACLLLD